MRIVAAVVKTAWMLLLLSNTTLSEVRFFDPTFYLFNVKAAFHRSILNVTPALLFLPFYLSSMLVSSGVPTSLDFKYTSLEKHHG